MSKKHHFDSLITNKAAFLVPAFIALIKYECLVTALYKMSKSKQDTFLDTLCQVLSLIVRKHRSNVLKGLPHNDCDKICQIHSKPDCGVSKMAVIEESVKETITIQSFITNILDCLTNSPVRCSKVLYINTKSEEIPLNRHKVSSIKTNKDIFTQMVKTFFNDMKTFPVKTELLEIPLSKHEVIDKNHRSKTAELNGSTSITDVRECGKSEFESDKTVKQNDSKEADNETEIINLLVKNRQIPTTAPVYHVYMTQVKSHPQTVNGVRWHLLNAEQFRLATFAQYPHTAQKSAILLANGGFAYSGSGREGDDTVICYFCCALKQGWLQSDNIQEVHRILSPDCCMVTGANCNNIPMTVPLNGDTFFTQFYSPDNANGNTVQNSRHKQGNDLECDGSEGNAAAENRNHLAVPASQASRDVGSAHLSELSKRVSQTNVPSGASNISINQEATRPTAAHNSPLNNGASSNTVSSNRNTPNPLSTSVISSTASVTSAQQGSINNVSSTQTAAASARPGTAVQTPASDRRHTIQPTATQTTASGTQHTRQPTTSQTATSDRQHTIPPTAIQTPASDRQHMIAPTATQTPASDRQNMIQPPATTPSQVNRSPQNSASAVSTAAAATDQSASQSQGNSSESATGSSQTKGPTYGELGIITERPKRFEYAVTATRFASFEHWPRNHPLHKEDLADAGFYYAGYGDCARCFYCGGGLRNWEDDDNVWVEHARWFPKCAYIRQTVGQQFVDTVQDLNKHNDKITFKMVTDKMGSSAASFQLDTRSMPLKRDPAVLTVLEMGYSEEDVIEAANFVKDACGTLSSDKVFEKLEMDGKSRGNLDPLASTSSGSSQRSSDPAKDERVMNKLKEENGQLRQQTVCKICMDKEVAVVFLPCGHFVSCTDCAAAMKDCPVCRKQVRGIVRAFMG